MSENCIRFSFIVFSFAITPAANIIGEEISPQFSRSRIQNDEIHEQNKALNGSGQAEKVRKYESSLGAGQKSEYPR